MPPLGRQRAGNEGLRVTHRRSDIYRRARAGHRQGSLRGRSAIRQGAQAIHAALAKMIAADGCNQICQKALNVFGGYGLMMEYPVQRYLRDSYFPMIGGGTSDIMRLIVSRQLSL